MRKGNDWGIVVEIAIHEHLAEAHVEKLQDGVTRIHIGLEHSEAEIEHILASNGDHRLVSRALALFGDDNFDRKFTTTSEFVLVSAN